MPRPIVAMLTDFGTADHYVGAMKGVVLSICPDATIVDLTHGVAAHDVLAGSLELAACWRLFPPGTVFLAVVDPGVGTSRRGIAAEAGEYRFVAPDNGVLTAVFNQCPPKRVVSLTERRYARATISKTFEGRDRFAPAAGWLARGVEVAALGSAVKDYATLDIPQATDIAGRVSGCVLSVDRFGNLVTNIPRSLLDRVVAGGAITIQVGPHRIGSLVETYADAPPGEPCALVGSTDRLEIAVNGGRAVDLLNAAPGTEVVVVRPSTAVLG